MSALGFPIKKVSTILDKIPFFKHEFHNFKLSKSVENAYHALAIDDKRQTFHPALWDPEVEDYQTLEQLWFAGMHTDVGGGYKEHELSDIPFSWLCNKAISHGLRIYDKTRIEVAPKVDGKMHDSMSGWWQNLIYREKKRRWPTSRTDKPVIHESVVERAEKVGEYKPWILETDYEVQPWENG